MGLFKKKKKVEKEESMLPELPESEDLTLPSIKDKGPELPELPEIPGEKTEEQKIKAAVTPLATDMQKSGFIPSEAETKPLPEPPTKPAPVRIEERPMPAHPAMRPAPIIAKRTKGEPIYIRLDKFELTKQTFDEIKDKVQEIERLLMKVKEIKVQEEKELSEWEAEVGAIKARIEAIDKNVFGQLE